MYSSHSVPRSWRKSRQQGFSFVELLIGVVLAAILVAVIYQIFINYKKTVLIQEDVVDAQQAGRIALSRLKEDLMLIGRNVKLDQGQEVLIYAAPWELLFNGDVTPAYGEAAGGTQIAYGPDNSLTYTVPALGWLPNRADTSAETVHFFIHNPTVPNVEKHYSFSPYDREVRRQINDAPPTIVGFGLRYDDGTSAFAYADGEHVIPLFTYWGDFDLNPTTTDTLWGDTNGDGKLDTTEIIALLTGRYNWAYQGPSGGVVLNNLPAGGIFMINNGGTYSNDEDLNHNNLLDPGEDFNHNGKLDHNILATVIHRVELNLTTISQNPDNAYHHPRDDSYHFRETWINSAVEPRNLARTQIRDCGPPPLPPSSASIVADDCGRDITLTWGRSGDDGIGANDVLWYEVSRKVEPEHGGVADWVYVSMMPASGATSYTWVDGDTSPYHATQYHVVAVDCGASKSPPTDSNSVIPLAPTPTAPDYHYFYAYDSAAAIPGPTGSITLVWQASLDGGLPDPGVIQYWIYRSDPEDVSGANDWPIAKVNARVTDPGGPNNTCTSVTSLEALDIEAHIDCVNQQYWTFGNFYVWHDEVGSPGTFGGAMAPVPGGQFHIGVEPKRYFYYVRAVKPMPGVVGDCISNPTSLQTQCGDYSDVQSYDCGSAGTGRARFSPPIRFEVSDATIYGYNPPPNNIETTRFDTTWAASLSEFCNTANCQKPTWYYMYRGHYVTTLLEHTNNYSFNWDNQAVLVFKAAQANQLHNYEWMDTSDPETYNHDPRNTPMYLDLSKHDLEPVVGSTVDDSGRLITDWSGVPEGDGYNYIVAAVKTDSAGNPTTPWGFGASCNVPGTLTSYQSCPGALLNGSYCEQHSMHGDKYPGLDGDDSIDVYFQFSEPPRAGTTIFLYARPWSSGGDWGAPIDQLGPQTWAANTLYTMQQTYAQQVPGTIYEYSIMIQCDVPSGGPVAERRMMLNAVWGACTPGIPKWCYASTLPGCPADSGPYCDDANRGKVVFYITDTLPVNGQGLENELSQTEDQSLWFTIRRFQRYPGQTNFPVIAQTQYLIRADGLVFTDPTGTQPPPIYTAFPGLWQPAITANERRYRFQEYLDPNLEHQYQIEVRVSHNGAAPRFCSPPASTCNGPDNNYIFVDFRSQFPCYPYNYNQASNPPANPYNFAGVVPIQDMERDWFPGASGHIEHGGIPWKNYEVTLISIDFWGIHWHVGDHYFQYTNGALSSDLAGFWGGILDRFLQWISDIGFGLCDWCLNLWGLNIFCFAWLWGSVADCKDWMGKLFNHSFLWSNFNAGVCGSNGAGDAHKIKGDFLATWRWKSKEPNRRLVFAFRGYVDPLANRVDSWLLEQSFEPTNRVTFTIGYEFVTNCEDEFQTSVNLDDQYDSQWWTNLLMVCTKRSGNDNTGLGQMFVFWWSLPSDFNPGVDIQPHMYDLGDPLYTPVLAWHTIGATFGSSGPYYNSTPPYDNVGHVDGAVGFWADPYVDWNVDDYLYSGIRLIQFCGACPPEQLQGLLPAPYAKMEWPAGVPQRKGACADSYKKTYEYNQGVPPVRRELIDQMREHHLQEMPRQIDPWYNKRKHLPNRYNRP